MNIRTVTTALVAAVGLCAALIGGAAAETLNKATSGVDQQILTVDYTGEIRNGVPVTVGKAH